jgi:hypothetical protein
MTFGKPLKNLSTFFLLFFFLISFLLLFRNQVNLAQSSVFQVKNVKTVGKRIEPGRFDASR